MRFWDGIRGGWGGRGFLVDGGGLEERKGVLGCGGNLGIGCRRYRTVYRYPGVRHGVWSAGLLGWVSFVRAQGVYKVINQ